MTRKDSNVARQPQFYINEIITSRYFQFQRLRLFHEKPHLSTKEMPNLLSPFDKHPEHVGYCLSCYKTGGPVYMIPLDVTTKEIKEILKREHPISGMPLEKEELKKVYPYVQGYIELCWHEDLEFYLEGMNLPDDWEG